MNQSCEREIRELHGFFEQWCNGQVPPTDEALSRCDRVLAADFQILNPWGGLLSRDELFERLRIVHGGFGDRTWRVRIDQVNTRMIGDNLCMATYVEWQDTDGDWTCRHSSAIFRRRDDAPNGVEWVHVQETFVDDPDEPKPDAGEIRGVTKTNA